MVIIRIEATEDFMSALAQDSSVAPVVSTSSTRRICLSFKYAFLETENEVPMVPTLSNRFIPVRLLSWVNRNKAFLWHLTPITSPNAWPKTALWLYPLFLCFRQCNGTGTIRSISCQREASNNCFPYQFPIDIIKSDLLLYFIWCNKRCVPLPLEKKRKAAPATIGTLPEKCATNGFVACRWYPVSGSSCKQFRQKMCRSIGRCNPQLVQSGG